MKTNKQKGFIIPLLIGIIAVLIIGGGVYVYSTKKAEKVDAPLVIDSNLPATTTSPNQSSVIILYPKGGETLVKGQSLGVTWKASPDMADTLINIYITAEIGVCKLGSASSSAGFAQLTLRDTPNCFIPTGQQQVISMEAVNHSTGRSIINTSSAYFTIVSPTADQISDWKTYTNTQSGFSFQYPQNWSIKKENSDVVMVQIEDGSLNGTAGSNRFIVRSIGDLDLNYLQSKSLKNDTGWQSDHKTGDTSPVVPMRSVFYQSKNINLIMIGFDINSQNILNQIASTFKFTN